MQQFPQVDVGVLKLEVSDAVEDTEEEVLWTALPALDHGDDAKRDRTRLSTPYSEDGEDVAREVFTEPVGVLIMNGVVGGVI